MTSVVETSGLPSLQTLIYFLQFYLPFLFRYFLFNYFFLNNFFLNSFCSFRDRNLLLFRSCFFNLFYTSRFFTFSLLLQFFLSNSLSSSKARNRNTKR